MVLKKIIKECEIPEQYKGTPIYDLIAYQNCDAHFKSYTSAQMLIGMCMDNRKHLHIPENFAYIIRTGGANLRYSEFKVSYAIAIGGIKHIALIGHNQCGMVNLMAKKDQFVEGLCHHAGWSREKAEEHFMIHAPVFEIEHEVDFVRYESRRLSEKYPGIIITPLLYTIEDNLLSIVMDSNR